jgi:hypothetical protein
MVLRPDQPTLYYYDRATAKDSVRDLQLVTIIKMYRLLWIAVVLLAGIILPGIREYMFILAGVSAVRSVLAYLGNSQSWSGMILTP